MLPCLALPGITARPPCCRVASTACSITSGIPEGFHRQIDALRHNLPDLGQHAGARDR